MKNRSYTLYRDATPDATGDIVTLGDGSRLVGTELPLESFDRFDGDIVLLALPIHALRHIGAVLRAHDLVDGQDNFYTQCQDVIAVPEKHQNERGTEGKLNFQAYFHDVPHSMMSINDRAIVVLSLHAHGRPDADGLRPYRLMGYVHANEFEFAPNPSEPDQRLPGYYYNMLRISEHRENGQRVYRRAGIFSLMFAILLDLVTQNDIHFVYATMGQENEKINSALKKLCDHYDKHWDIYQVMSHTKINKLFGRAGAARKMEDITDDEEALRQLYDLNMAEHGYEVFNQYPDFESFHHILKRITGYSKSSRAWAIRENGRVVAGSVGVNWGDYFALLLENPKGVFKMLARLELTDRILYPWMTAGSKQGIATLYKGMAYHYLRTHRVKVTLLNEPAGDAHRAVKKSIIQDPFNYFVIYDRPAEYQAFKERSKRHYGHERIFLELPMV